METEPQRVEAGHHVIAYSIHCPADAQQIYQLLANPHRHHEVDGSKTVQSRAIGPHQLSAGAKFSVHMRKFGLPYRLPLRVTAARAPGQAESGVVEWRQPAGHRWRWEFQPHTDGTTTVTEAFDTSAQNRIARTLIRLTGAPKQNAESIKASLRRVTELFQQSS